MHHNKIQSQDTWLLLVVLTFNPSFSSIKKHTFNEYLEANLLDNYNTGLIRKIVSLVQDEQSLDVHEIDSNLPAIFTGQNFELDYLDARYQEQSAVLYEKYFK